MNANPFSEPDVGDILIIKYNDTYWHTMLVVSGNRIAHAPGAGEACKMELIASFAEETKGEHKWSDDGLRGRLHAYRYTGNQMLYPNWVAFAERWCVADASNQITHYAAKPTDAQLKDPQWRDYPRYRGVLRGDDDTHNAAALPFGVDALSRTLKWARKYRYNEAFSINRGTTCCAFVMACIQAAFVNAQIPPGVDGDKKLAKVVEIFESRVRGTRQHTKGEAHAGGALRANSNRNLSTGAQAQATTKGFTTDAQIVSGIWKDLLDKGFTLCGWDDVGLPASLCYDVKYVYSRTLNHLLLNDTASWTAK